MSKNLTHFFNKLLKITCRSCPLRCLIPCRCDRKPKTASSNLLKNYLIDFYKKIWYNIYTKKNIERTKSNENYPF